MLEIAIISDIHHGPDRGSKKGSLAKQLMAEFFEWVHSTSAACIIDLGDRISDVDSDTDARLIRDVGTWFSCIDLPHYHLPGNHDIETLSLEENEEMLRFPLGSQSFDLNGFHFILWNSGAKLDQRAGFTLHQQNLDWLANDLNQTNLPSIVFSHIPLDNGSLKGNFYFDKVCPHQAYYCERDGERIREVLERSRKVKLCINGHTHWNAYHCIDRIHYVTLPSLTETFATYPNVSKTWSRLVIEDDFHIQVVGNLPIEYRLPIASDSAGHWLNVDKDYAPQITSPR